MFTSLNKELLIVLALAIVIAAGNYLIPQVEMVIPPSIECTGVSG